MSSGKIKNSTPSTKRKFDSLKQEGSIFNFLEQPSSLKTKTDGVKPSSQERSVLRFVDSSSSTKDVKKKATVASKMIFESSPEKSISSCFSASPSPTKFRKKDSTSPKEKLKSKKTTDHDLKERMFQYFGNSPLPAKEKVSPSPPYRSTRSRSKKSARRSVEPEIEDVVSMSPQKSLPEAGRQAANPRNPFKIRKQVEICPDSPNIDISHLLVPPKNKTDAKTRNWPSPKVKIPENRSSSGRKQVLVCPESPMPVFNVDVDAANLKRAMRRDLFGDSDESSASLPSSPAKKVHRSEPAVPKRDSRAGPKRVRKISSSASSWCSTSNHNVVADRALPEAPKPQTATEGCVLRAAKPTASARPVVRLSQKDVAPKDLLSIASTKPDKTCTILPTETRWAAGVAFAQTYGSLDGALAMTAGVGQVCPDFAWAAANRRSVLAHSFTRNFGFHARLQQDAEAVRLLRLRTGRHCYPNGQHVHDILNKIIPNAKDRVTLHRSLDLLDRILAFHPTAADGGAMRNYYWSVMALRFDDKDPCSRWEYVRTLLEALIENEPWSCDRSPPTAAEAKNHVVAYLVRVLNDDLRYWIDLVGDRQPVMNDRSDMPLLARLFWPQAGNTIGYYNGNCRDLIRIHLAALEKKKRDVLEHTRDLLKMVAAVVQLCDLQVPLKIRRAGERMTQLGHAMAVLVHDTCQSTSTSVASVQLRLLVSSSLVHRLEPSVAVLTGPHLTLTAMLQSYLGLDVATPDRTAVVERFRDRQPALRWCVVEAIAAYLCVFCTAKTWFFVRDRRRYPSRRARSLMAHAATAAVAEPTADIFSGSFPFAALMDDLKAAKLLLHSNRDTPSVYSLMADFTSVSAH